MEDASLDEFFDPGDEEVESAEEHAMDDIEQAVPTARWGEHEVCGVCETETSRLWNDDGQFVCPDCKEW